MIAWEEVYRKGERLDTVLHPEIGRVADFLEEEDVARILDLGSGRGKHVVYLSRRGFNVHGCDVARTGLVQTAAVLGNEGLEANLVLCDMSNLPYDPDCFDAVISVQVIHHNTQGLIKKTIDELSRILKAKGLMWLTVPISKNEPSIAQIEIEPGTFLPLDGPEKGLPHHYFKAEEIRTFLSGFSILDLHNDVKNHFSILARECRKDVKTIGHRHQIPSGHGKRPKEGDE